MTTRTVAALVAALVLLGAVAPALALPALGPSVASTDAAVQTNDTNESASLGASISGFMQTSAASAEGEVDNGVFRAEFANASNESKRAMVTQRTATLEQRLERLRAQRNALLNGSDNLTVAERAKAARLATEIDELKQAINTTDDAAAEAGVNATRLERLRTEANELDGPEVAELARGLAGQGDRGTPENRGPPEDRGQNRTDDGDDDGDDANETDDETDEGPPSDDASTETTPTPTETDSTDATETDDDADAGS